MRPLRSTGEDTTVLAIAPRGSAPTLACFVKGQ